jgi:predicted TIM-barrel fold metal-dependent hydrolase
MLLKDYAPRSCLEVGGHDVPKPCRPAFDFHMHWGEMLLGAGYADKYRTADAVESIKSFGVMGCVNLCGFSGDKLKRMLGHLGEHNGFVKTFGNVDVGHLEDPDWERYAYHTIRESVEAGMCGMKFWKFISLRMKDKSGRYIAIDDPRLQVIWQAAAEFKIPVLIHIADPVAFFHPIDEYNERWDELMEHPDWSFCAEGLYSFRELMAQQDNLMAQNRGTAFVVAHVGSYAENLAWVGAQLDKHPNMHIDISSRIAELGRQPYTSRKFFHRYADRILFGTDFSPLHHDELPLYYRFLETYDEYFPYDNSPVGLQGRWRIYGIGLEPDVLDKVYYTNAAKLLNMEVAP